MEVNQVKKIIEVLLFITDNPIPLEKLKNVLGEAADGKDVEKLIKDIASDYEKNKSPLEIRNVAGGWQTASKKEYASWVRRLYKDRTTIKLSNSAIESLSIIAYKQPITRAEIEEIRGVEVNAVLETLLERKLVKVVGRKETVGRPLLYGTSREFLRHFGLNHLSELPSLEDMTPPEEETDDTDIEQSEEVESSVNEETGSESEETNQ